MKRIPRWSEIYVYTIDLVLLTSIRQLVYSLAAGTMTIHQYLVIIVSFSPRLSLYFPPSPSHDSCRTYMYTCLKGVWQRALNRSRARLWIMNNLMVGFWLWNKNLTFEEMVHIKMTLTLFYVKTAYSLNSHVPMFQKYLLMMAFPSACMTQHTLQCRVSQ